MKVWGLIGITLLLFSCHRGPTDFEDMREDIEIVAWQQMGYGCEILLEDEEVDSEEWVQECLKQPLDHTTALAIAWVSNPEIQAWLDDVSIAQADFFQLGLLRNPIFDANIRYPDQRNFAINSSLSLMQSLVDILQQDTRKALASADFQKNCWIVLQKMYTFSIDFQKKFVHFQALEAEVALLEKIVDLNKAAVEFTTEQLQAGTISFFQYEPYARALLEAEKEWVLKKNAYNKSKHELAFMMGLDDECGNWLAQPLLAEMEPTIPPYEELICIAYENRWEIQIRTWEIEALCAELKLTTPLKAMDPKIGISSEHEVEAVQVTGPAIEFALPLFDWGQGRRKRLAAQLCKAVHLLKSDYNHIKADILISYDNYQAQKRILDEYKRIGIPASEAHFKEVSIQYGFMSQSVYNLLKSKESQLTMQIFYLESIANTNSALLEIEQALGVKLSEGGCVCEF